MFNNAKIQNYKLRCFFIDVAKSIIYAY